MRIQSTVIIASMIWGCGGAIPQAQPKETEATAQSRESVTRRTTSEDDFRFLTVGYFLGTIPAFQASDLPKAQETLKYGFSFSRETMAGKGDYLTPEINGRVNEILELAEQKSELTVVRIKELLNRLEVNIGGLAEMMKEMMKELRQDSQMISSSEELRHMHIYLLMGVWIGMCEAAAYAGMGRPELAMIGHHLESLLKTEARSGSTDKKIAEQVVIVTTEMERSSPAVGNVRTAKETMFAIKPDAMEKQP